jgi:hypothetical protein
VADFDDRKRGFEGKFAHDEELRFKLFSRANKLLGLWAAELLGKTDDQADLYAQEVTRAGFAASGREGVVKKLVSDLGERADETAIRSRMDAALVEAQEQLSGSLSS